MLAPKGNPRFFVGNPHFHSPASPEAKSRSFVDMTKISKYAVTCISTKVCSNQDQKTTTTEFRQAKDPLTALKASEKSLLDRLNQKFETVLYDIMVRKVVSENDIAEKPSISKRAFRHPRQPRCIDFVGHSRPKHDWGVEQPSKSGDELAYTSMCRTCGMQRTIHRWNDRWNDRNPRNERHEYRKIEGPRMPLICVIGTCMKGVSKLVTEAVTRQFTAGLADFLAKSETVKRSRLLKASYVIRLTPGMQPVEGKSMSVDLRVDYDATMPIRIEGVEDRGDQTLYCSRCGWLNWTGHDEARHGYGSIPMPKPKTSITGPFCRHCDDNPKHCCQCGERVHWKYVCSQNRRDYCEDGDNTYCKDCVARLGLSSG